MPETISSELEKQYRMGLERIVILAGGRVGAWFMDEIKEIALQALKPKPKSVRRLSDAKEI